MDWLTAKVLADGIEAIVYAINYDTYEITLMNRISQEIDPNIRVGSRCYEIFFGQSAPCKDCPFDVLRGRGVKTQSLKWIARFEKWLQVVYHDLQLQSGMSTCIVTAMDVTPMQEALSSTQRVLDGICAAAYTIDTNTYRFHSINWTLRKMLPDIKVGDLCYEALWDSHAPCDFCPLLNESPEDNSVNLELYNRKLNKYLSIDMVHIGNIHEKELAVFTGYDITRRVESEHRLRDAAYIDSLTGLNNRLAFMKTLGGLFDAGASGCLCLLHIKNIRQYNLIYRKGAGDELLKQISDLCCIHYPKDHIYRISGAKFGFLADNQQEVRLLRSAIAKIHKNFSTLWDDATFHFFFGVVFLEFPAYAKTPEQAVYSAEYVLQRNRKTECDELLEFGKVQQEVLNRNNRIEEILRNQAFSGRLSIHYQPIYDIQTNSYSKCEALLRMNDEQLGAISPIELIPIAEQCGYIGYISKFVLEEVCAFLASRQARGLSPLKVNVNVSPIDFARKDFCEDVISVVERWGVPPNCIQLEIIESIYMNSVESTVQIMKRLIAHGFSFAIDDFGTGYSNLSYIGVMPIECLKLDKSFMDMLLVSDPHRLIVTNIIKIAQGLQLSIVAEGIESEKQYELVKSLGSTYIQGFLFSKPLPKEELEAFLEKAACENMDALKV